MTFDDLVAKCPNPCCWEYMRLVRHTRDNKIATFQCIQKKCKVDFLSMQIALTDTPSKKRIMK